MSYLSRNDIEAIAVRVFSDYKNLSRHMGLPIARVDPMILATELCGLHIDHFHLSKDGLTLGMTSFNEFGVKVYDDSGHPCLYYLDGATILIERDLKDAPSLYGRYNFTLLHETAHQILSRLFPNSQKEVQNRIVCYRGHCPQYPIQDWSEWQADNLASALLLPVELVLGALYRFDLENGIEILNKVYRLKEYERFCEMAAFLGASKQALAIRLKRLGLLKKEYLKDPHALVDVVKEDDD